MKAYALSAILVLIFSCSCSGYIDPGEQGGRAELGEILEIMMEEGLQMKEKAAKEETVEVQQVSFTWPHGPFSFPKTFADCPLGFTAGNNCVLQDNENYNGNNNEFVGFCLVDGRCTARDIRLCYCTQQVDTSTYAWPNGDYCIARFGGVCPAGFSEGELFWDDENSSPGTSFNGAVPDGVYNANTRIFYCCRNDGSAEQSILLPTDDPFILYAHSSSTCQAVFNMRSHSIELFTDDENNNNQNSCTGSHPFDTGCGGKDHRVHLCLYY